MQPLRTPEDAARWLQARVRGSLHCDSRKVQSGDGFIAWPGAATDGRRHVPSALAQGASACLIEGEGAQAFAFDERDPIATYTGLKAATGPIAAAYYAQPSEQLAVIAVTGTNGKTSTAWWLAQALSALQPQPWPCGVIGTLGVGVPPQVRSTGLTTPDPVLLHEQFRAFADAGVRACAIEASSIGIAERRLDGTRIRTAVFTNFTQDHLDYHGSMAAYWQAKAELFRWPGLQAAVVNIDDEKGAELAASLQGQEEAVAVWTVSCERDARLRASNIGYGEQGLRFTVSEAGEAHVLETALIGHYNVSNLLGVIGVMRTLGVPLADAARACAGLLPVPGRMELVPARSAAADAGAAAPTVAVDYAHTPDALDKALQALRPLARQRGGKLWCVFGCGGDRDPIKRPLMAAVAEKLADRVVVTSDNPRHEKPEAIVAQMLLGLSHSECVEVQVDRAKAIAATVSAAGSADVILLAGKGHEDYQEIAGEKHPFDDRLHAAAALARRSAA